MATQTKTYTERLQLVRDAIDKIVSGGQTVQFDGRSLSRANLEELTKLETLYESRAAREANPKAGRSRIIYVTPQ